MGRERETVSRPGNTGVVTKYALSAHSMPGTMRGARTRQETSDTSPGWHREGQKERERRNERGRDPAALASCAGTT